jgi:hypothetical protein
MKSRLFYIYKAALIALLFLSLKTSAQVSEVWLQRYNHTNNGADQANDIAMDNAGNIYVTGTSSYGYATVKYNSSGVLQWTARYQGNYYIYNEAFSVTADNSGNVYVTGTNGASGVLTQIL